MVNNWIKNHRSYSAYGKPAASNFIFNTPKYYWVSVMFFLNNVSHLYVEKTDSDYDYDSDYEIDKIENRF